MEFIPYQRLTITTDLSKDEVVSRLRDKVGPTKRENFVRVDKNIFSGRLGNEKFELTLIKDYRNSWTPEITGTISEKGNSTEITLTLKSNMIVIGSTIIAMLFGVTMSVYEIIDFKDTRDFDWMVLLFILFPYGLCWLGFNLDADKSIDGLIKLTKGEIK
jgi:hypothetical protein